MSTACACGPRLNDGARCLRLVKPRATLGLDLERSWQCMLAYVLHRRQGGGLEGRSRRGEAESRHGAAPCAPLRRPASKVKCGPSGVAGSPPLLWRPRNPPRRSSPRLHLARCPHGASRGLATWRPHQPTAPPTACTGPAGHPRRAGRMGGDPQALARLRTAVTDLRHRNPDITVGQLGAQVAALAHMLQIRTQDMPLDLQRALHLAAVQQHEQLRQALAAVRPPAPAVAAGGLPPTSAQLTAMRAAALAQMDAAGSRNAAAGDPFRNIRGLGAYPAPVAHAAAAAAAAAAGGAQMVELEEEGEDQPAVSCACSWPCKAAPVHAVGGRRRRRSGGSALHAPGTRLARNLGSASRPR